MQEIKNGCTAIIQLLINKHKNTKVIESNVHMRLIKNKLFSLVKVVLLMTCAYSTASYAQGGTPIDNMQPSPVAAPERAKAVVSDDPKNGYAEMLKPTKRAVSKAPAVIQNRPYAPISKPYDDEGQIPEIEMFVGESRVFPTPGVARIAVGNGSLLTAAALDGREVILFANGAGTSSLFIWNADGRYQRLKINIVQGDMTRQAREIASFLATIPKAKATVIGGNIIVDGNDMSDDDLSKIDTLAKRYPQIVNFTNRVGWEQMVMMDVKVVEFPVSLLREVGLKWSSTGGVAIGGIWGPIRRRGNGGPYQINLQTGQINPPPITSADGGPTAIPSGLNILSFLNLGLNAQLDLLAQDGKATVLAEPQLSARNGATAKFLAGGEIPYAVSNRDGVSLAFKSYGIKLEITPKVDRHGAIRATILTEVSNVDASLSTTFGPALLTRRAETEFNVREGESLVLSGLLQRDLSSSVDKVPFLGDIPILGALFRSKKYQNKETELVIFVTPTIVNAQSPGNIDRIQRTTERLEERLGAQPYLSEPLQKGVAYEHPNSTVISESASSSSPSMMTAVPSGGSMTQAPISVASSSNLAPSLDTATTGGSLLTVTADMTALRAAASPNSAMLMQLDRGSVVRLGSAEVRQFGSVNWRNVTVGSVSGWVPINTVQPFVIQRSVLPIPSLEAQRAQQGKPMQPTLTNSADTASSTRPRAITLSASPEVSNSLRYRVLLNGLALRVTPDMNSTIVSRMPEGTVVQELPEPPRGAWFAVQMGEGTSSRRGWAASQWLQPLSAQ